jgi:hypothetical protein
LWFIPIKCLSTIILLSIKNTSHANIPFYILYSSSWLKFLWVVLLCFDEF